jgi:hypothetical protein
MPPQTLQCLEQSNLLQRLGPWRLFSPAHASCHWVLDLSHPGHEEVARKLVGLAVAGGELPNFWNIRLRGEWHMGIGFQGSSSSSSSNSNK